MDTLELVVPYISVAIAIVLGVLLVIMAIAMRNANKCLQKAVDEKDAEIKEGFKKMKTLVQFSTHEFSGGRFLPVRWNDVLAVF